MPADWPLGLFVAAAAGLALAGVAGLLLMAAPGRVLRATGAGGIVALQLARTGERARALLEGWGSSGRASARRHLRADFLFAAGYAGLLWLLAARSAPAVGARTWAWVGTVCIVVAWLALAAGVLDALENVVLLRMLGRPASSPAGLGPSARAVWLLAVAKFLLVVAALAWLALVVYPAVLTPAGGRAA